MPSGRNWGCPIRRYSLAEPARLGGLTGFACPHGGGCRLDGILDRRIAGAAAQCVFQGGADIFAGGVRFFLQQGIGGHDLARDAEATLDRAMNDEGFLEGVQLDFSIAEPARPSIVTIFFPSARSAG